MPETARRIVLASRPVGEPKPSDFRLEDFPVPQPGPGEMLLKTKWLSLDPYMRGRMSDAPSYAKPVGINEVMEAGTVSEVVASNNGKFARGDIVLSRAGWQTHMLSDGSGLRKLDPKLAPVQTSLGVLGMPGMTAYTGLLEIGKPQAGGYLLFVLGPMWWTPHLGGPDEYGFHWGLTLVANCYLVAGVAFVVLMAVTAYRSRPAAFARRRAASHTRRTVVHFAGHFAAGAIRMNCRG